MDSPRLISLVFPDESELLRLCMSKKWAAVSMRSQSHPFEAAPSELAIRGKGTTALGIAVRSGAPRDTIQLLVEANIDQVAIVHFRRGNILTEAIAHGASDEVLDYLLRAIIHYQSTRPGCFDILGVIDDLGRTALHSMVERAKQAFEAGQKNPSNWYIFRNLLMARPDSIIALDKDGNTPLVSLLLHTSLETCGWTEQEICRMVQLMVSYKPCVAAIARTLPEPWNKLMRSGLEEETKIPGNGNPTPLYYAILYGRSLRTIEALLKANQKVGNPSSTIVTHYHEVPLHIAISRQSSLKIISKILQDCPESTLWADLYGLTPIDWLWIRHVMDWFAGETPPSISQSRHLAGRFIEWHENVTKWICSDMEVTGDTHPLRSPRSVIGEVPRPLKRVTEDLLDRMRILLPGAAAAAHPGTTFESWSLVHAACYVQCPLAMVHLAIENSDPRLLSQADDYCGRLPLHYATSRLGGYAANFPVGFSREVKHLVEASTIPSLVCKCKVACCMLDRNSQLPLHILLDAARYFREMTQSASCSESAARFEAYEIDSMEDEAIISLVAGYPECLECRDGKSQLLPFQQAAIGPGARLDTVYFLLRQLPSLVVPTSVVTHIPTDRMEL